MFRYGKINDGDLSFSTFAFPGGVRSGQFQVSPFLANQEIQADTILSAIAFYMTLSSKSVFSLIKKCQFFSFAYESPFLKTPVVSFGWINLNTLQYSILAYTVYKSNLTGKGDLMS